MSGAAAAVVVGVGVVVAAAVAVRQSPALYSPHTLRSSYPLWRRHFTAVQRFTGANKVCLLNISVYIQSIFSVKVSRSH